VGSIANRGKSRKHGARGDRLLGTRARTAPAQLRPPEPGGNPPTKDPRSEEVGSPPVPRAGVLEILLVRGPSGDTLRRAAWRSAPAWEVRFWRGIPVEGRQAEVTPGRTEKPYHRLRSPAEPCRLAPARSLPATARHSGGFVESPAGEIRGRDRRCRACGEAWGRGAGALDRWRVRSSDRAARAHRETSCRRQRS